MITYLDKKIYWNYFISIEEDLYKSSRFIEFDRRNENVFSIELVRLLISSSSEFEIVAKELCRIKEPDKNIGNINDIRNCLTAFFTDIFDLEIIIPRFGLNYKPLINWKDNKPCDWWDSYNSVKHHRDNKYERANLKSVINAVGALYIINLLYYNSLQAKNENKAVAMEETTLVLKHWPCLFKINRQDFYMLPYSKGYTD